jgi:spore coat-associated protein N
LSFARHCWIRWKNTDGSAEVRHRASHGNGIAILGLNLKTTAGKVVASLALVGTAAGVAGLGTYGAFTSTTSASASVGSGIVNIALGTTATTNRLNVPATGLVPGDSIQRAVTLTNAAGNQNLAGITLTTTAATSSLLDSPVSGPGLQLAIDACSLPWIEAVTGTGASTVYTYTCTGATVTTVLAPRAVLGTDLPLPALTSAVAGKTDYLRVTMTLPPLAGNDLQNKSSVIDLAFTGTQRTGTSK